MINHSENQPSLNSILDHNENSNAYESWYSLHLALPHSDRQINNAPNEENKKQRHSSCKKYEKFKGFKNKSDELSQSNESFDIFGLINKSEQKKENLNVKENKAIHNNSNQMLKNYDHQSLKKTEIQNRPYSTSFCDLNFHKENKENTKLTKRSSILPKFIPKREKIKHTQRYLPFSRTKCPLADTSNQISTKSMQKFGDLTEKKSKVYESMLNIKINEVTNDECKECKRNKEIKEKYELVGEKLKMLNGELRQQVWTLERYLSEMKNNFTNMFFYPIQKKDENTTDSFCFNNLILSIPTFASDFQTQNNSAKEKDLELTYEIHEQSPLQENFDQIIKDIHNKQTEEAIAPYMKTKEPNQSAVHCKENKKPKNEQMERKVLDKKKEAEVKKASCFESFKGKLNDDSNILNDEVI